MTSKFAAALVLGALLSGNAFASSHREAPTRARTAAPHATVTAPKAQTPTTTVTPAAATTTTAAQPAPATPAVTVARPGYVPTSAASTPASK